MHLWPKNLEFKQIENNSIMPIGIVLKGKKKLHFNLLYVNGNGEAYRFEPHYNVTHFYNEKRLNQNLTQCYPTYKCIYDYKVGTSCVCDAFEMVKAFFTS